MSVGKDALGRLIKSHRLNVAKTVVVIVLFSVVSASLILDSGHDLRSLGLHKAEFAIWALLGVTLIFRLSNYGLRLTTFAKTMAKYRPGTVFELAYLELEEQRAAESRQQAEKHEAIHQRIAKLRKGE